MPHASPNELTAATPSWHPPMGAAGPRSSRVDRAEDLDVIIRCQGKAGRGPDPVRRALPCDLNDAVLLGVDKIPVVSGPPAQRIIARTAVEMIGPTGAWVSPAMRAINV